MKFPLSIMIVLGSLVGLAIGLGAYTFLYAKGYSYMTDNPEACVNCHVMNEQYSGWLKSSHRSVAVCNDCHTPAGFLPKYLTKAENSTGFHAPQETARILGESIDFSRKGQNAIRDLRLAKK